MKTEKEVIERRDKLDIFLKSFTEFGVDVSNIQKLKMYNEREVLKWILDEKEPLDNLDKILNNGSLVVSDSVEDRILRLFKNQENLTSKEVSMLLQIDRAKALTSLNKLFFMKLLERSGRGDSGQPYKFKLKEEGWK